MMFTADPPSADGGQRFPASPSEKASYAFKRRPAIRVVSDRWGRKVIAERPLEVKLPLALDLLGRATEFIQALQAMHNDCDRNRWERFLETFFEQNARIEISVALENGVNRFLVGRLLMSRFFRTFFECASEHWLTLDEMTRMTVTEFPKSATIEFCEGRWTSNHLSDISDIERSAPLVRMDCRFSFEIALESVKFRTFVCDVYNHQVYLPRPEIRRGAFGESHPDPTRGGLPEEVLCFLRTSELLSSMLKLITLQKRTGLTPRECLIDAVRGERQPVRRKLFGSETMNSMYMERSLKMDRPSEVFASRKRSPTASNPNREFQPRTPRGRPRRKSLDKHIDTAEKRGNHDRQKLMAHRTCRQDIAVSQRNGATTVDRNCRRRPEDDSSGSPKVAKTPPEGHSILQLLKMRMETYLPDGECLDRTP